MRSANLSAARAQQKVLTSDQRQIVDAVNIILTALRTENAAKLTSVIAPDFCIFDGGTRLNEESLTAAIEAQHVAGRRYEWSVTEPDIHVSGKTAWVASRRAASLMLQAA